MNVFLTSHLNNYKKKENIKIITEIDNSNGLVDQIKSLLTNNNSVLYFPTDPNYKAKVE